MFLSMAAMAQVTFGPSAQAQQVTEQKALQKAKSFLTGKTISIVGKTRSSSEGEFQPYYVFNAQEGGFVIVSGDERTVPILGFSDNGHFDVNDLPDNLRFLLARYESQIQYIQENNVTAPQKAKTRAMTSSIAPMLTSAWGQGLPYRKDCKVTYNTTEEITSPSGCIAVCMAQVMYYYAKKSDAGRVSALAIPAYNYEKDNRDYSHAALPATTFEWDNLKDTYSSNETGESADAVAKLMHYCGAATQMMYGENGSGVLTRNIVYGLTSYLGYAKTAHYEKKENYLWSDWASLIDQELSAGRPVIYGARDNMASVGDHAFVIDGYDASTDFYHVNFGWGNPSYNSYYALYLLNPDRGDGRAYNKMDDAIFGISPVASGDLPALVDHLTVSNLRINSSNKIEYDARNYTGKSQYFDCGIGYMTSNSIKEISSQLITSKELAEGSTRSFKDGSWSPFDVSHVDGLTDGDYKLVPISKVNGTAEWQVSTNPDINYILVTVVNGDATALYLNGAGIQFPKDSYTTILGQPFITQIATCRPLSLTVTYSSSNTDVATVDGATGAVTVKNIGQTTIKAIGEGTEYADNYTLNVVKKVDNPTIILNATSFFYDGTAKEPTVEVKDGDTTIPSSEYTVSYENNTNVGTATVKITDKDGGNYIVSGSTTFSIVSADGSLTPPTGKSDLVYTGAAQDLITAGSSTTGTVQYSLDGTNYGTSIPQGTDAKEYTIYYKVVASPGYNDIAPASFKVSISPKTVSSPTITLSQTSYTYDGTAKEPAVTMKDGETAIPNAEFTISYSNNTEVGTAVVTITDKEGGNYTVSGSATFSITEAEPATETTPITIGKSGKASYCGDKSLDFSFSDEVKAYIATGFDKDEGTIWLTRVKDVPAGVPVLIKGEANKTYDVPVTDSENSYYTNMFVGNTSGEKIQIQETDGDMVNYYLSGDGTFKSVNKTANIGNNKCYLQLPGTFEAAVTGATQTVKVGSIGKASFAAPVDLDFTNVSGLKAFTATGYDKSTKTIWLTRVMKVQKGEGVLLKGDPNSYEIPSAAVQSSYENMFVGNTSGDEIRVQETSEDGSQTNYYLSGKDGSFVSVNGFAKIGNNKCYLALPTSMVAGASSTRSVEGSFIFEEPEVIKLPINFRSIESDGDGTTSIKELTPALSEGEGEWYTLQGQRVAKPGKGVYIKNGKKVVIK